VEELKAKLMLLRLHHHHHHHFLTRWCPAIKLMLRVAVQVNAFSRSFVSRGSAEEGHPDLQREVAIVVQKMKDGADASRDMVHVVRRVECCL
jgi:hypothetical protein